MRVLRFLFLELGLRGIVFTLVGTLALVALYLVSIGAPAQDFLQAGHSFILLITGSPDFSRASSGFSASQIISAGAATTFPLSLGALVFVTLFALLSAAVSCSSAYMREAHGNRVPGYFSQGIGIIAALLTGVPLFVGYWILAGVYGINPPFILIALMTVLMGGLGWDAARFLIMDMKRQMDTTHTTVFTTLGPPLGSIFPLPGTLSGYLLNSSAPRFIPYLAGKVPAIIGSITIAEMVFSFPGLGRTLLESLLLRKTDQLIAAVFVLLAVNALVALLVKTALFIMYPRWYEKSI